MAKNIMLEPKCDPGLQEEEILNECICVHRLNGGWEGEISFSLGVSVRSLLADSEGD